eukprot:TRINITY_DN1804_c3_g1_i1.p1 TRINITY_DN1804_c3_g1~~TRINITY_DN1804_c3_g1_i1.p1  ORF type:complete len:335 (+),score=82.86 TRINITY_DN1804_c3_g1_i1:54-1058(+)
MGNTQGGFKAKIIGLPGGGSDKDKYSAQQRKQSAKFQKAYSQDGSSNYGSVGNYNGYNNNNNVNTATNNNNNFVTNNNSDYNSSGYSAAHSAGNGSWAGSPLTQIPDPVPNFRNEVPNTQKQSTSPSKKSPTSKTKPKVTRSKKLLKAQILSQPSQPKPPKRYNPSEEEVEEHQKQLDGFLQMFSYSVEQKKQNKVKRTWNTKVVPPPVVESPRKAKVETEVMPLPIRPKASFTSPQPSQSNVVHLGRGSGSPRFVSTQSPSQPLQSISEKRLNLNSKREMHQPPSINKMNDSHDVSPVTYEEEDSLNLTLRENAIISENEMLAKRLAALEQSV